MIESVKLRIARHTERLEEAVAFYRDRLGFCQTGGFTGHAGYDGVFLAIPGTETELELTSGGGQPAPEPHPETLLVLSFETESELDAVAQRIGQPEVVPANPFWQANARAYADPDGFLVLLTVS